MGRYKMLASLLNLLNVSANLAFYISHIFSEFDPGSGWTLAVDLTHASTKF